MENIVQLKMSESGAVRRQKRLVTGLDLMKRGNNLQSPPKWIEGGTVNEVLFCKEFLQENPMISINGTFFNVDERIEDESELKKKIYEKLKFHITSGISKRVSSLLEVLRMECSREELPFDQDRIHVANGTLFLDGSFEIYKDFCRNRLPVAYNPEAKPPEQWIEFLNQLLEPEDILTLQEFMGYCLLPTNKGQKMLLITGKGGEGKSRIGIVMKALMGCNMKTGSIAKVESSPFARADLEHLLVMVDDDMKMEALKQTNNIKAIITAELPMDLEKKGVQSYQGDLRVRFMAFGNGTLQALHDRSYGFFRRQIILSAKERDPKRQDDPDLAEKLCDELEGIFLWAVDGLKRLIANRYQFTVGQKAQENLKDSGSEGNNILEFMRSQGYFRFAADSEVSSREFYEVYRLWCEDNALNALGTKSFSVFLKQNSKTYGLEYTNKVHIGEGKMARGFWGVELLQRPPRGKLTN